MHDWVSSQVYALGVTAASEPRRPAGPQQNISAVFLWALGQERARRFEGLDPMWGDGRLDPPQFTLLNYTIFSTPGAQERLLQHGFVPDFQAGQPSARSSRARSKTSSRIRSRTKPRTSSRTPCKTCWKCRSIRQKERRSASARHSCSTATKSTWRTTPRRSGTRTPAHPTPPTAHLLLNFEDDYSNNTKGQVAAFLSECELPPKGFVPGKPIKEWSVAGGSAATATTPRWTRLRTSLGTARATWETIEDNIKPSCRADDVMNHIVDGVTQAKVSGLLPGWSTLEAIVTTSAPRHGRRGLCLPGRALQRAEVGQELPLPGLRCRALSAGAALVVCLTALFAPPDMAGGYRLAKWGLFGLGLAALAFVLFLRLRTAHAPLRGLPRRAWLPPVAFVAAAVLLPAFSPAPAAAHWPPALLLLTGLAFIFVTAIALTCEADAARARRTSLVFLTGAGALCATLVLLQAAGLRWMTKGVPSGLEFRAPGTFGNPQLGSSLPCAASATFASARGDGARPAAAPAAPRGGDSAGARRGGDALQGRRDDARGRRARLPAAGRRRAGAEAAGTARCSRGRRDHLLGPGLATGLAAHRSLAPRTLVRSGQAALSAVGRAPGDWPGTRRLLAALMGKQRSSSARRILTCSCRYRWWMLRTASLQFAAEGGFITAAAFVATVLSALTLAWRDGTPLGRGVGAAVAALFVNGLADPPLRMPVTFALFFFLLGWQAAATSRPETQTEDQTSRRHAGPTAILLLAALLLGVVQGCVMRRAICTGPGGAMRWTSVAPSPRRSSTMRRRASSYLNTAAWLPSTRVRSCAQEGSKTRSRRPKQPRRSASTGTTRSFAPTCRPACSIAMRCSACGRTWLRATPCS